MDEIDISSKLFDSPANRRLWLLHKALECLPLDRAIALAREVETFLTDGAPVSPKCDAAPSRSDFAALPKDQPGEKPRLAAQTRLALTAEQRERLMGRLAQGATNAELASEFGLSLRQVQGIRMNTARKNSKIGREVGNPNSATQIDVQSALPTSVDDVIRYLRQRDDIVVPRGDGEFLVNGRFQLSTAELVTRANKMRSRQGKPEFALADGGLAQMQAA